MTEPVQITTDDPRDEFLWGGDFDEKQEAELDRKGGSPTEQTTPDEDPRIKAAADWLRSDDTAYEDAPNAAVRAARGMLSVADEIERLTIQQTTVEAFEHEFSDHVGLAQQILAAVPDNYTETQLDDIGRRARHWVMKAYREWESHQGIASKRRTT